MVAKSASSRTYPMASSAEKTPDVKRTEIPFATWRQSSCKGNKADLRLSAKFVASVCTCVETPGRSEGWREVRVEWTTTINCRAICWVLGSSGRNAAMRDNSSRLEEGERHQVDKYNCFVFTPYKIDSACCSCHYFTVANHPIYSTHLSDSMEALMYGVTVLNTGSIYSKTRWNI